MLRIKSSQALLFVEFAMFDAGSVMIGGELRLLHIHVHHIKPRGVTWMIPFDEMIHWIISQEPVAAHHISPSRLKTPV
jgi:hypothetical protein